MYIILYIYFYSIDKFRFVLFFLLNLPFHFRIKFIVQSGNTVKNHKRFLTNNPKKFSKNSKYKTLTRNNVIIDHYKTFKTSLKSFTNDVRKCGKIYLTLKQRKKTLDDLSLDQIRVYHETPKAASKMIVTLVGSMIPVVGYIVLILAYLCPRYLLCAHFWTKEQEKTFMLDGIRKRYKHGVLVFRVLERPNVILKCGKQRSDWKRVVQILRTGYTCDAGTVLQCRSIFSCGPLALEQLTNYHAVRNFYQKHYFNSKKFVSVIIYIVIKRIQNIIQFT